MHQWWWFPQCISDCNSHNASVTVILTMHQWLWFSQCISGGDSHNASVIMIPTVHQWLWFPQCISGDAYSSVTDFHHFATEIVFAPQFQKKSTLQTENVPEILSPSIIFRKKRLKKQTTHIRVQDDIQDHSADPEIHFHEGVCGQVTNDYQKLVVCPL